MRIWRMPKQANYYRLAGLHEKCLKVVSEGLELSRATGIHLWDRILLWAGVASAQSLNDHHQASAFLTEMASSTHMTTWDTALYHGLKMRENIRLGNLIQNLSWLGRHWQGVKNREKALECYQQGLNVDDVAEEFYQEFMICYQKLGRRPDALFTYQRCRKTFILVLG